MIGCGPYNIAATCLENDVTNWAHVGFLDMTNHGLICTGLLSPPLAALRERLSWHAKVTSAQDVLPTSGLLATAMEMPNIDRILAVNITV